MRIHSSLWAFAIAGSTMLYSNAAFARDSVVVPLYSPNLDANKVGNITSLITSEVDFSGRYDMVSQADSRPKALTPKCLKSVSCLKPIATDEGVNAMVTGSVTKMGGELEFFIVLYENEKIIRMKRFRIEDSPLSVAANVGGFIQEVVTGQAVEEEEDIMADVPLANDVLEEEGDIFGGADEDPLGDFSLDPEEEERKAQERAELERQREEREEAERKRAMEEQARRLAAEAEAQRKAQEAQEAQNSQATDDFDFNFAPSTVEVVKEDTEEDDADFSFDEPEPVSKPSTSKPLKEKEYKPSTSYSKPKSTRSKTSSNLSTSRINADATLTGKVGGGNFQTLNFVTYGGEVGIHLSEAVSVHIGGEGYATNQPMPVLDEEGNPTDLLEQSWRVLIPLSLGLEYHFEGKMSKPYVGADMQILPAYAGTGSGAAVGIRARAGSNFMVADGFGINLNVAFGFWNGQYFKQVPSPAGGMLNASGLAPQLTVGPVIAF